ncbi:MAG: PIN domain-containing protein [Dehalococcoidia bacterium]|nr:PIN domain-containing protein [Dehalococcoidia bacterium]
MILCDAGPIVSALNRNEGPRYRFAADLLQLHADRVVVPWPIYAEVDLLLRRRGRTEAAALFGRTLQGGGLALEAPTFTELGSALDLLERQAAYNPSLADAVLAAMAEARNGLVLTWDFRHLRALLQRPGEPLPFLVHEGELPGSQPQAV